MYLKNEKTKQAILESRRNFEKSDNFGKKIHQFRSRDLKKNHQFQKSQKELFSRVLNRADGEILCKVRCQKRDGQFNEVINKFCPKKSLTKSQHTYFWRILNLFLTHMSKMVQNLSIRKNQNSSWWVFKTLKMIALTYKPANFQMLIKDGGYNNLGGATLKYFINKWGSERLNNRGKMDFKYWSNQIVHNFSYIENESMILFNCSWWDLRNDAIFIF